jgi:hypothetical protein
MMRALQALNPPQSLGRPAQHAVSRSTRRTSSQLHHAQLLRRWECSMTELLTPVDVERKFRQIVNDLACAQAALRQTRDLEVDAP